MEGRFGVPFDADRPPRLRPGPRCVGRLLVLDAGRIRHRWLPRAVRQRPGRGAAGAAEPGPRQRITPRRRSAQGSTRLLGGDPPRARNGGSRHEQRRNRTNGRDDAGTVTGPRQTTERTRRARAAHRSRRALRNGTARPAPRVRRACAWQQGSPSLPSPTDRPAAPGSITASAQPCARRRHPRPDAPEQSGETGRSVTLRERVVAPPARAVPYHGGSGRAGAGFRICGCGSPPRSPGADGAGLPGRARTS